MYASRMLVLEPSDTARGTVLFGPGAGGDPARYRGLLEAFADAGFVVLAPTHERFDPRSVSTEQLLDRVDGLRAALVDHGADDLPVIAAGHSVGAWAAVCLAGGQPWTREGRAIPVVPEERVSRLVLYAPTLGWFRAPGALAHVRRPITAHVGSRDTVTPPGTAELLRTAPAPVSIRTHENVGHHDFMTELPPSIAPTTGLDHAAFLRELAQSAASDLAP